jgi:hypothetical protein
MSEIWMNLQSYIHWKERLLILTEMNDKYFMSSEHILILSFKVTRKNSCINLHLDLNKTSS